MPRYVTYCRSADFAGLSPARHEDPAVHGGPRPAVARRPARLLLFHQGDWAASVTQD